MKIKNLLVAALTLMISFVANAQLNGTYKIGTGEIFEKIGDAVDSLNLKGITGPVHFQILDGSYQERFSINNFPGESATDTVLFESISEDAAKVLLQETALSTAENYIVKLNGCERVTFRNMSLQASSSTYQTIALITNGASFNRFEKCAFSSEMPSVEGDSVTLILDVQAGESENYNHFKNNVITGGWVGLAINGTSASSRQIGNIVEGNKIEFQTGTSFVMHNHDYGVVRGNHFSSQGLYAVQLSVDSTFFFQNNEVETSSSGVWISNHDFVSAKGTMLVSNNIIRGSTGSGLTIKYSRSVEILHNTVYTKCVSPNYTLDLEDVDQCNVFNNIFYNDGNIGPLRGLTLGASNNFDNNNYYSTSGDLGVVETTPHSGLSTWQATTGSPDINSSFELPQLRDLNADLRLDCGASTSFISSQQLSLALLDIDGNMRAANPWKGAAELRLPDDHKVSLNGYVTDGGTDTIRVATLELYADTSEKVLLDKLFSLAISVTNGYYEFADVPYAKEYWIKIIPDGSLPQYVKGYHNGELRWDQGDAIVMTDSCVFHSQDIFTRKLASNPAGISKIKGKVTDVGGIGKTYGTDPIPGLDVILDKIPPSKNTIAVTQTNSEGEYEFAGLSDGIYVVTIEYEGLPADTIYEVTIAGQDSVVNLDYCVDTLSAIQGCSPELVNGSEVAVEFANIYPNPFTENLAVKVTNSYSVDIKIYSITGEIVYSSTDVSSTITISTQLWTKGIYIVELRTEESMQLRKMIKR